MLFYIYTQAEIVGMILVALGQTRMSSLSFNKCWFVCCFFFFEEICFLSRVEYTENVYRVEYTRENNFGC